METLRDPTLGAAGSAGLGPEHFRTFAEIEARLVNWMPAMEVDDPHRTWSEGFTRPAARREAVLGGCHRGELVALPGSLAGLLCGARGDPLDALGEAVRSRLAALPD